VGGGGRRSVAAATARATRAASPGTSRVTARPVTVARPRAVVVVVVVGVATGTTGRGAAVAVDAVAAALVSLVRSRCANESRSVTQRAVSVAARIS
jgi:hypothetical protein